MAKKSTRVPPQAADEKVKRLPRLKEGQVAISRGLADLTVEVILDLPVRRGMRLMQMWEAEVPGVIKDVGTNGASPQPEMDEEDLEHLRRSRA